YPTRPATWPEGDPWPPDKVLALVQAGMLQGKSIGFLPLKVHAPTDRELEQHGWRDCGLVIDEWLLLEYACVFLPANQNALVEAVSKGRVDLPPDLFPTLGLDPGLLPPAPGIEPLADRVIPFTPLAELERHIERQVAGIH